MRLISNNEIESEKQKKKFPLSTNISPELVSGEFYQALKIFHNIKVKKHFQTHPTHPTKTRQRPQRNL